MSLLFLPPQQIVLSGRAFDKHRMDDGDHVRGSRSHMQTHFETFDTDDLEFPEDAVLVDVVDYSQAEIKIFDDMPPDNRIGTYSCPFHIGDVWVYDPRAEKGAWIEPIGFCRLESNGHYRASIFDGKQWRNFRLAGLVPDHYRYYDALHLTYDTAMEPLLKLIRTHRGAIAVRRQREYVVVTSKSLS